MHERSIENTDKLIENLYGRINKLRNEQKKDLKNLQKSTISLHKNVMSMSDKEFNSIQ